MEIENKRQTTIVRRLLIANRGEIVSRILSTCETLGIETVVIYSTDDAKLPYVEKAFMSLELEGDELEETYLNQDKIIKLALKAEVDAIHPGYGFLSENADFAQNCLNNKLLWIGPDPSIMRRMADKTQARKLAQNINIPTIPAFSGTKENLIETLTKEDLPILLKAAAGGGGRGMRIVKKVEELDQQIDLASREAKLAFGDGRLFIEKYLDRAKHIEVQILGDNHGNYVHLYERECTIQRRYQKIIEESPAASISESLREKLTRDAIKLAKASGYNNAGTVEFLVDPQGAYYFIETNARIQVEHPVTEMVTGIDLIEQQIRIAEGIPLSFKQEDIRIKGHAVECRICAENPKEGFIPSPGIISHYYFPESKDSRIDTALFEGAEINTSYDSLIAKFIVHKDTREEATDHVISLLKQSAIFGIDTNIPYLIEVLNDPDYKNNNHCTSFIESKHKSIVEKLLEKRSNGLMDIAVGSFALLELKKNKSPWENRTGNPWKDTGYWRAISDFKVEVDLHKLRYEVHQNGLENITLQNENSKIQIKRLKSQDSHLQFLINGKKTSVSWKPNEFGIDLSIEGSSFQLVNPLKTIKTDHPENNNSNNNIQNIPAPLPGKLSRLQVRQGELVEKGQTLAIIESMKIENQILATQSGKILKINIEEGAQIKMKESIMTIESI